MVVEGTPQDEAVSVWFTPGPVTVQVPSTPEAETVSTEVPPVVTRSGTAVMVGVAVPHGTAPTVTVFEQATVDPPAVTLMP